MDFRNAGFTLMEVLIALTILAIALAAATRAAGVATDSSFVLKERMLASWVAQNRLAMHLALRDSPDIGVSTGSQDQAGQTFQWQETVGTTDNSSFRRIEIKVFGAGDESHVLSQVIGYLALTGTPGVASGGTPAAAPAATQPPGPSGAPAGTQN